MSWLKNYLAGKVLPKVPCRVHHKNQKFIIVCRKVKPKNLKRKASLNNATKRHNRRQIPVIVGVA